LTLKNVAVKLGRSLDPLTEQEIGDLFGPRRIRSVDRYFPHKPSPGPQYVVGAAPLAQLPMDYFSTGICIFDFDQAFPTDSAPIKLPYIPHHYLAPECIFNLTNGPAADVWALGCILFTLKDPIQPFCGVFESHPQATAEAIGYTLGPFPEEWMAFPFLDGWPVHEPLKPDLAHETVNLVDEKDWRWSLEAQVGDFYEPCRPASSNSPSTGLENFCLHVPTIDHFDRAKREKFNAENKKPIGKEDAKLLADLLRKMFNYDHTKRITAIQVLEHPWMREPGKSPRVLDALCRADKMRASCPELTPQ
jgi:serine/threonine protein kinase